MTTTIGYSLTALLFVLAASLLAFGENTNTSNPCGDAVLNLTKPLLLTGCKKCVSTKVDSNTSATCVFVETSLGSGELPYDCQKPDSISEGAANKSTNADDCAKYYKDDPTPAPTPVPTTSTTPQTTTSIPTTTPNTTTPAPTTKSTTTPTTPSTTPTTQPTTTNPSNSSTTTAVPSSKGTSTTAAPSTGGGGGFSFATFLGGIVFTLAVSSLAYVVWRFYKARTERNYHTL